MTKKGISLLHKKPIPRHENASPQRRRTLEINCEGPPSGMALCKMDSEGSTKKVFYEYITQSQFPPYNPLSSASNRCLFLPQKLLVYPAGRSQFSGERRTTELKRVAFLASNDYHRTVNAQLKRVTSFFILEVNTNM
nr:hypothetical protein Iba_chr13aCG1790 [Ipomoea batatas]